MSSPRDEHSPAWLYWPVALLARILFLLIARVRVVYFGDIPKEGGCILAPNHISHFDPPALSGHLNRRIDWLAMAELFHAPWSTNMLTAVGCIRVERNKDDRGAVRAVIRRLGQGRMVGIFPEGGLRDGERSIVNGGPMQQGAAMIGAFAQVPVVPVVILGTERLYNLKNWLPWRRIPVWIGVGAPIPPPQGLPRDQARKKLQLAMAEAFVNLKEMMREKYSLTEADMPHSPQQRMQEP